MIIETTAKLILTIPEPAEGEFAGDFVLLAEQEINQRMARFYMPKTKTKVGIRVHISGNAPKVIK